MNVLSRSVESLALAHDGRATIRPIVLIGFAEALAAPEVAWSLVDSGCQVVAFARKGHTSALRHSRHVVVHEVRSPETDIQGCRADIENLMLRLNLSDPRERVLFPLNDTAVWLCSDIRLPEQWTIAGPTGCAAELALNKERQCRMARDAGFNVPETAQVRTGGELRAFVERVGLPVILKPAECVPVRANRIAGCGKWICANREEVENAIKEWAEVVPLLAQTYITGTGEGLFGLSAADGVRAWSAHRRIRMMNPQGSGSSACISQAVSDDLKTISQTFISASRWRGLFMIELLRDAAGKLWFVEINGRPWGSMALSRRQGLEYPAWHVSLMLDQQSQVATSVSPLAGVVCRHLGREVMNLLFVLRGPRSKALQNWPSFWKTVRDVLRVRRDDFFYNWRRDDSKVFFADCYYTIHDNIFKSSR